MTEHSVTYLVTDERDLAELVAGIPRGRRVLIGVAGVPGSGKSTFATALVAALGEGAVAVPMDGFHLADVALDRLGLRSWKGKPETFDAWGYAAALARLRAVPPHPVYLPAFDREIEQPVAGSIAVTPEHDVVVTEGNYLLLDDPEWRSVRSHLDQVWYVHTDDQLRLPRLVARHERFGKSPEAAREWVERVDQPNARLVAASAHAADRVLDLTKWRLGAGEHTENEAG